MAGDRPLARRSLLIVALAVVLLTGIAIGTGPANGDVVVYLHEASSGIERWTHVGYVGICWLVGDWGSSGLDAITVLAGALAVAAVFRRSGPRSALVFALALAPALPWGEVDVPWLALVLWSAVLPGLPAALLCAVAVTLSPAALLALPWLGRRAQWIGAAFAVVGLSLASGGDWWTGPRGVLHAPSPRVFRSLEAWLFLTPLLLGSALCRRREEDGRSPYWTLLLLLLPPDLPSWGLAAAAFAHRMPQGRLGGGVLLAQAATSLFTWTLHRAVIVEDNQIIASFPDVPAGHGVIAPWSYGVRLSMRRAGHPYASRWVATPAVRDQQARWCADPPETLWTLHEGGWRLAVGDPVLCERPNLVLVIGCSVRKDRVSPATMPALSALEGARFADAMAAAPWTRPAAAAVLTGEYPTRVGIAEPTLKRNNRALSRSATTLAEVLKASGYQTLGATANPNLDPAFGFDQGFDRYHAPSPPWRTGVVKVPGDALITAILDPLEPPFYLQIVLVETHAPVDSYAAGLRALDASVLSLRTALAERGYTDENTVFVFLADHGEGLSDPEHHGPGHGRYLYPSTLEVPWIVTGPELENTEIRGLASHVDVRPTLLSHLGIADSTYQGPGISHARSLRTGEPTQRRAALADTWFQHHQRSAIYTSSHACFRDDSRWPDPHSRPPHLTGCWNRSDPTMSTAASDPALEETLRRWSEAREREIDAIEPVRIDVDAGLGARLEALGYQ